MSDQDKHTTLYSSSDIEKYLRGELSAPEMHALERAALDDPFLADALDGIALHRLIPEQPAFSEDVAELQERLKNRVAEKEKNKTRKLPLFMRYAAVLILLLGLGFTAYYMLLDRKPMRSLVQTEQQHKVPENATVPAPATADSISGSISNSTAARSSPSVQPAAGASDVATLSRPLAPALKKAEQKVHADDVASAGEFKRAEKEEQDKAVSLADGQSITPAPSGRAFPDTLRFDTSLHKPYAFHTNDPNNVAAQLKGKAAGVHVDNNYKSLPADQLVFSGKVIDQNNHPLPGAFLALKNNVNVNATTDKYGFFNLRLNNKLDTTSAVVVNYVGYEQASMLLNTENRKGNIIQLQPQTASLNEVVIEGYGARRREVMRQNIDAQQKALSLVAIPADGWPAYKDYLELNKRSASLDPTLRGNETISFIVNRKGELSSFKVEQSISPAHDSATIQMIKQGPSWKLLSGKKARARVILTY